MLIQIVYIPKDFEVKDIEFEKMDLDYIEEEYGLDTPSALEKAKEMYQALLDDLKTKKKAFLGRCDEKSYVGIPFLGDEIKKYILYSLDAADSSYFCTEVYNMNDPEKLKQLKELTGE